MTIWLDHTFYGRVSVTAQECALFPSSTCTRLSGTLLDDSITLCHLKNGVVLFLEVDGLLYGLGR